MTKFIVSIFLIIFSSCINPNCTCHYTRKYIGFDKPKLEKETGFICQLEECEHCKQNKKI